MTNNNHTSDSEQKKEDWMNSKWRPMMGWMYMAVCACDFMIFPVLWSIHQALDKGQVNLQWQPLTLQGAGLFHIAMGAVLGIAAYGRTKEKMAGAENGGLNGGPDLSQGFGQGAGTQYTPPGMNNGMMGGMNNNMGGGFNSGYNSGSTYGGGSTYGSPQSGGFNSPSSFGSPSTSGSSFGGSAPTFSTAGATCPNTGKPLGPAQTFPAI